MSINWQTKKLGEICNIEIGKTPPRSNKKFWDTEKQAGNIWLSIRDLSSVQNKFIFDSREYISDEVTEKFKKVKKGTLLVSFKLTLGRLAFAGKDLYTNEAIASLQVKNEKEICKEYLYRYLSYFDWNGATDGDIKVKGRTLNKAKLKEIKIPLFPLSEQKRIVKVLDEAFEKIEKVKENTEKNLKNSKELFESYLQNIFANPGKDWEEKKLGEVCDFYNGKAHEKVIDPNGHYIVINSKFISSDGEKFKKTKKALFPLFKEDIVMVMSDVPNGKALAKCYIVDKNDTYSLNQRICAFRSKVFQKRFLYLQLNRNKYLLDFNNGENQTNLRKDDILNCPLYVPPIAMQKSIISKLDLLSEQTKKLEKTYKKKLADLEELKKSILNKAFNGGL